MYALTDNQGAAIPETVLCAEHHARPDRRNYSEQVAEDRADNGDMVWREMPGDEARTCCDCADGYDTLP